jgi:hypothetical protein
MGWVGRVNGPFSVFELLPPSGSRAVYIMLMGMPIIIMIMDRDAAKGHEMRHARSAKRAWLCRH